MTIINNRRFLNYFLLVFWMGIIFFLSSQPDLKSGFESQVDFILRKIAHITEYGILTFLAWRVASDSGEKKNNRYLIIAVIFSAFYAISDEYHQTFIRGRVGSPADVMIDNIGVLIAAVLINVRFFYKK